MSNPIQKHRHAPEKSGEERQGEKDLFGTVWLSHSLCGCDCGWAWVWNRHNTWYVLHGSPHGVTGVSQIYKNINDQLKLKNNSKMRQFSLFKNFVFIWNSVAHKTMMEVPKGSVFLLGENLHLSGPPCTPGGFLPQPRSFTGWLTEGSPRPSESSCCEFLWVGIWSDCLFFLFSVKMNCQYALCPDNHLVETQKKLQNRMEVISLKCLLGLPRSMWRSWTPWRPWDLSRVAGVPGWLALLASAHTGKSQRAFLSTAACDLAFIIGAKDRALLGNKGHGHQSRGRRLQFQNVPLSRNSCVEFKTIQGCKITGSLSFIVYLFVWAPHCASAISGAAHHWWRREALG